MKYSIESIQLTLLRASFWLLGKFNPKQGALRAQELMSKPRPTFPKPHEQEILADAVQSTMRYRNGNIQLYRWGNGSQTIMLVHGWEGRAGNFAGLIPQLVASDWSVIALEAPSHGQSDQQPTSMFDFTDCVGEVLKQHPTDAIVAHSFGCVATTASLSMNHSHALSKLVMVASPNRFEDRLQQMVDIFQLSPEIVAELRPMLAAQADFPIFDLNISDLGERIKVPSRLLIHDKADRVTLFEWSQQIADEWAKSIHSTTRLIPIEGTGHKRILWDERVIHEIVDFLSEKEQEPTQRLENQLG